MKLGSRDVARFCKAPDASLAGALLYGPDAASTSMARRDLVHAISEGDDLRVTRLDGGEIKRDPATLDEALRARGFFPGRRVVVVTAPRDDIATVVKTALADADPEDAFLVVEAGGLKPSSALRKLFESEKRLAAGALYPEPPGAPELREMLRTGGCMVDPEEDALGMLGAIATDLDVPQLRQLIEKICLYKAEAPEPLTATEVEALSPLSLDSELGTLVDAVALGRTRDIPRLLGRFAAAGTAPVQILILTGRHFRQLLSAAASAENADAALARLRPPVFGPRRSVMREQLALWPLPRIEAALRVLQEADRTVRSAGTRPDRALVERSLIRLSIMAGRR